LTTLLRSTSMALHSSAFVVDASGIITFSGHPTDPEFEQALQRGVAQSKRGAGGSEQQQGEKKALALIA
jgi:hypothetical protein